MWELDCEESWVLKNWCFWTVVLEKTVESPLDCKEIQPVHSEGDQPWDFFGRNDAKGETPILWPPHAKYWLIGKDSDAGRDWGRRRRGWDGWMALPTRRTWVWVNSGSWWWTGRPGMLRFMGLQRVGHDWVTELNWTGISICTIYCSVSILYFWLKEMTCILYYFLLFIIYFMHCFIWSPESSSKFDEKKLLISISIYTVLQT